MELKGWNYLLCVLHFVQSIVQFVFAAITTNDVRIPVLHSYPTGIPWNTTTEFNTEIIFYIQPMYLVASFLLITAISHFASAMLYENQAEKYQYILRACEYSVTSTIMVIAISMMSGINDLFAIICLSTCNVAMIMCGAVVDAQLQDRKKEIIDGIKPKSPKPTPTPWLAFSVGCVLGGGPWVSIFTSLGLMGPRYVPGLVYAVTVSICWFFFCFAVHAAIVVAMATGSLKQIYTGYDARWYLKNEEYVYMLLSLFSKTNLSWMVFAAFIIPSVRSQ